MTAKAQAFIVGILLPVFWYSQGDSKAQSTPIDPAPQVLHRVPNHESSDFTSAENRWRIQAVDISQQVDPVALDVRTARNKVWSRLLLQDQQLADLGLHGATRPGPMTTNDVAKDPSGIWVVASFDRYLVIPVDEKYRTMYTEMRFTVKRVVLQPKQSMVRVGNTVDVDIKGGRIKDPSGQLRTFDLSPKRVYVEPGNTYLLKIKEMPEGHSFQIIEHWKVADGRLVEGHQPNLMLTGRSVEDAAQYILNKNALK